MKAPTVADVDRIARGADPILRNLQITQCYYEISQSAAQWAGFSANWCSFATWASKQAGQTIRMEDLIRAFEERFYLSAEISSVLEEIAGALRRIGARLESQVIKKALLRAINPAAAFSRASDAVARGNKKVFEEIGREYARFLSLFYDDSSFDSPKMARFCSALRPGDPPDGQRFLGEAFTAYGQARFHNDAKEKAELILLANLEAGFHEQVRLQPEIAAALNAALQNSQEIKRQFLAELLPLFRSDDRYRVTRLLDHELLFDHVFDRLVREANRLIRQVITAHLMTLHLSGEVLRLGRDLTAEFPPALKQIGNSKLKE